MCISNSNEGIRMMITRTSVISNGYPRTDEARGYVGLSVDHRLDGPIANHGYMVQAGGPSNWLDSVSNKYFPNRPGQIETIIVLRKDTHPERILIATGSCSKSVYLGRVFFISYGIRYDLHLKFEMPSK
jgi:hypothetical protein